MRRVLALLLTLLAFAVRADAGISKPLRLESEPGRFVVVLPPEYTLPKLSLQQVPSDAGMILMGTYQCNSNSSACLVAYSDYPPNMVTTRGANMLLRAALDGQVRNLNATIKRQSNCKVDGNPGISYRFSAVTGGQTIHGQSRLVFVSNRLYQLMYYSVHPEDLERTDIKNFFASFHLKP